MNLFRRRQDEIWDPRRPGKSLWEYIDDLIGSNDRIVGRLDALTAKVGELLDENAEIRGDIGELNNVVIAFKGEVMSQLSDVKADLATLKTERDEIVAFIESKAAELVTANGKVQELLAKVAELEQNVISPEEIAEVRADIQGVSDSLNTYTPPAEEEGDVEANPQPPIEGQPR